MILTDDKTGSNETRSQAELSPHPSVQTNPFDSAGAITSPYVHASESHESLHEVAGQAPPTYSPSVSSTTKWAEMFISNGRPDSAMDLVGASAASSSVYPNEKLRLPEYQETIATEAAIQSDGRIQASFAPSYRLPEGYASPIYEPVLDKDGNVPAMSINIMIVGSRGDVQPYIALGQQLQEYGHTVRISTHGMFRMLVKNAGLMFFNIGGGPNQLTGYMDRNPSLMPRLDSLKNGDVAKSQQIIAEILDRCLLSCYAEDKASQGEPGFAADLIVSNPPTFAHIHCAEALGIPLHLSFTMPWSPTSAFPQARICV